MQAQEFVQNHPNALPAVLGRKKDRKPSAVCSRKDESQRGRRKAGYKYSDSYQSFLVLFWSFSKVIAMEEKEKKRKRGGKRKKKRRKGGGKGGKGVKGRV